MNTKKQIKELLNEMGYSEEEMNVFWGELIRTNWICKALHNSGKNWKDLNISLIRGIPTQKERDEVIMKEIKEKKKKEEEDKKRKEYYEEHFEEIMVNKIDSKEKLTEYELKTLVYNYEIESIKGENNRWTRDVDTVVELCGRFFMIPWQEGLTEYQEDEFYIQPYEVKQVKYQKVIDVVEWKAIEQ